ncbi:MAG: tol-pal system protein YbgF [Betaproteobacteria bacterium]|nr:tol-pal system protein YbgF [Betaproteobacteria bacterium]
MNPLGPKTAVWKYATTTNNTFFRGCGIAGISLLLALAFFAAPAARGQLFGDETARGLAAANAEKLENLARVVQNLRGQLASLLQRQQESDQKQRELLGEVQEMSARGADKDALKELQSEISRAAAERQTLARDIADLGGRFSEISEYIALPAEQEIYESAYANYRRENYEKAGAEFKKVLKFYPDGKFNANARYWLSQNFMAQKQYEEAAAAALQIIKLHGGGDKVPDAMLTLAEARRFLGRAEESRKILEELVEKYPTTLAADKARRRLAAP